MKSRVFFQVCSIASRKAFAAPRRSAVFGLIFSIALQPFALPASAQSPEPEKSGDTPIFTLKEPPAPPPRPAINLPTLGDTASDDLSPATERKLGEEIMLQARESGQVFDDDETTEYLNQLGAALVAHAPPSVYGFEFFAVNDSAINAFALPGGFIGVNSGLIVAAQTESELASVMGHEMGHVIQRHIARGIGEGKQSNLVAMAATVLGMLAMARGSHGDTGHAALAMGQGYAVQKQLNFSRDAEREADRVGFQILQDAEFDVSAMPTLFGRLQQATRANDTGIPALLQTHPLTTERMADIQNRIRGVRVRQRPDGVDFQLIRARLKVLQNETVQGFADARIDFEDQLRTGRYASEAGARYGLALTLSRQSDLAGAQREIDRVRELLPGPNAIVENLAMDVRQLAGDPAGAAELAKAARNAFPQSRMIAVSYADALQQAGRQHEAILFLRDRLTLYRKEPVLHELLARSYAAQGNSMLEHKAMAENYFLRGSPSEALEQLQIARRAAVSAGSSDFYELSQIDARAREIQAVVTERKRAERNGERKPGNVSLDVR